MATMKKFRVVLDVTINDDETYEPSSDWNWTRLLELDAEGEEVEFISQELVSEWESDDEDDDDEPELPFSEGDRVRINPSTKELMDNAAHVHDVIQAAKLAGKTGEVIDLDPGNPPEILVKTPDGEETWLEVELLTAE